MDLAGRMSISIYIGHSGRRLVVDPSTTATVEALRQWLYSHTHIQPRNQILLTSQGKQVRTQTLLSDSELFVFDSSRLNNSAKNAASSPSSSGVTTETASSTRSSNESIADFNPGTPPDVDTTVTDHSDLLAWQNLFRLRKSWASSLLTGCASRAAQAERYAAEQSIIERSLSVAVASLQQHVKSAETKYAATESWAEEILQVPHEQLGEWEEQLEMLAKIPARAEFTRFVRPTSAVAGRRLSSQQGANGTTTLQAYVDVREVQRAAGKATETMNAFADKIHALREDLDSITHESTLLLATTTSSHGSSSGHSEPAQVLEEITLVVKKLTSDHTHVASLPRISPTSAAQAAKMASLHSRNYLPTLSEYTSELNALVTNTYSNRAAAAEQAHSHMMTLSAIESQLAALYASLKALSPPDEEDEGAPLVAAVSRLPAVYGQLLVESVRRREWVAKMKRDSITLQEEVATYQEEEVKRRNRWIKSVDDVALVSALQSNVLGIELNLQNEGGSWPIVSREELSSYLDILTSLYGSDAHVVAELRQAIEDLDKPTRKQIKHARAFKQGSMHEAAFGDTSLLLRGDEQSKTLREANTRLEDDLKAQRSRVRKLEDLLHRSTQSQSQFGAKRDGGDLFDPNRSFADRVGMMTPKMSEDTSSREGSAVIRQRRPSSSAALQQMGIGEDKKLARRIVDLEAELQSAREEVKAAAQSAEGRVDAAEKVRDEAVLTKRDLMENMDAAQREFATERRALEEELRESRERTEELEGEVERVEGMLEEGTRGMSAAHDLLMDKEGAAAPGGVSELSAALEALAKKTVDHRRALSEAIMAAQAGNLLLGEREADQKAETQSAREEVVVLTQQLEEMRAKVAEGGNETEGLRRKTQDAEDTISDLQTKLTTADSTVETVKAESKALSTRLAARADHAQELSHRLYAQDSRLSRLAERLGLVVSYQDDIMTVERASKLGASTALLTESRTPLDRTVSMTSPPPTRKSSGAAAEGELSPEDLALTQWTDASDLSAEDTQFAAFITRLERFSLVTLSDAIAKRFRDYEYTARKFSKDASSALKRADAYKIMATNYRTEAAGKIAVKDFKTGDLALFLPTRGQAKGAWAAFNVGCPHYFLWEGDGMRLAGREFVVARIVAVESRVVDMKRKGGVLKGLDDSAQGGMTPEEESKNSDNPFDLSDGLTWWMIHATEERGTATIGAPTTPGLGKSTVAAANVDAKGSVRVKRSSKGGDDASGHLNKSLESRRSSEASRRSVPEGLAVGAGRGRSGSQVSLRPPPTPTSGSAGTVAAGLGIIAEPEVPPQTNEQVRHDLLWGP